jgi:hypothetical protein
MIFDEEERTDEGLARHSQSQFGYLNRSGRAEVEAIRRVLESWFTRIPEEHRPDLRGRLRSNDNHQFHGAFFELYLHELLLSMGFSITLHSLPDAAEGKRPDFLIASNDGIEFYLEGTVATGMSVEERGADARLNQAYDALDKLESNDFSIGLRITSAPGTPIPGNRFRHFVREFLIGCDPYQCEQLLKQGGIGALPEATFNHEGWEIDVFPLPKTKAARAEPGMWAIGLRFYEPRCVDPGVDVRDAIEKKASRYGELGKPYFVAVNAVNDHLHDGDVMDALFGKQQMIIPVGPEGPMKDAVRESRLSNGAWHGPDGPKYTRVSGTLIVSLLTPWSVAAYSPVVWHNPSAQYPAHDLLNPLARAIPVGDEMQVELGVRSRVLLGFLKDGRCDAIKGAMTPATPTPPTAPVR